MPQKRKSRACNWDGRAVRLDNAANRNINRRGHKCAKQRIVSKQALYKRRDPIFLKGFGVPRLLSIQNPPPIPTLRSKQIDQNDDMGLSPHKPSHHSTTKWAFKQITSAKSKPTHHNSFQLLSALITESWVYAKNSTF